MSLRTVALLALLVLTSLAGCSDGPPSGKVVLAGGPLVIEGTVQNTYQAESGGQDVSQVPSSPTDRLCPEDAGGQQVPPGAVMQPCVPAFSNYKLHFMTLPEPSGDGYSVFYAGGAIGEKSLGLLEPDASGMWEANITKDVDEEGQFDHFELRMGSFVVATASSAKGSQAFVAAPSLSTVTVTGSYKGRTLTIDVQGLPEDVKDPVGRLYLRNEDGNLSAPVETFPVITGGQSFKSEMRNIGGYAEFHIHVGTSKIYLYQGKLD